MAADSRRASALSQHVRVEKVLGRDEDTIFLLVQADEARADFIPNYEYRLAATATFVRFRRIRSASQGPDCSTAETVVQIS